MWWRWHRSGGGLAPSDSASPGCGWARRRRAACAHRRRRWQAQTSSCHTFAEKGRNCLAVTPSDSAGVDRRIDSQGAGRARERREQQGALYGQGAAVGSFRRLQDARTSTEARRTLEDEAKLPPRRCSSVSVRHHVDQDGGDVEYSNELLGEVIGYCGAPKAWVTVIPARSPAMNALRYLAMFMVPPFSARRAEPPVGGRGCRVRSRGCRRS